jgi:hypothetical protein
LLGRRESVVASNHGIGVAMPYDSTDLAYTVEAAAAAPKPDVVE